MFLSARYRPNIWPFWVLIVLEFALTVALLAFVGIAAPNLYRTKLWQDGADNGFNSSPLAGLYAAANYRPYTTPMVWSQFITNYNLVIVVLSMFIMLLKSILYMLHCFPPIINCVLHLILIAIYTVAIYYQASPDMSDPLHPQPGPPWYITKSCSVTKYRNNVGYCMQAKATFFCFCAMLAVFITYFGFALFSCFPSKQHRVEYAEKQRLKKEKYAALYPSEDDAPKTARSIAYTVPGSPGIENLNPMTPRTFAFNKLSGTKNVPLRIQIGKKNVDAQPSSMHGQFGLRSPGFPRTPQNQASFAESVGLVEAGSSSNANGKAPMWFPPPPKISK